MHQISLACSSNRTLCVKEASTSTQSCCSQHDPVSVPHHQHQQGPSDSSSRHISSPATRRNTSRIRWSRSYMRRTRWRCQKSAGTRQTSRRSTLNKCKYTCNHDHLRYCVCLLLQVKNAKGLLALLRCIVNHPIFCKQETWILSLVIERNASAEVEHMW